MFMPHYKYVSKKIILYLLATLLIVFVIFIYTDKSLHTQHLTLTKTNSVRKTSAHSQTLDAIVTFVVDGDTIKIHSQNGKTYTVRLLGINTPEIKNPYRDAECFGKEASLYTKQNLSGKKVKIETDPTQSRYDKYGRLLAYVFLPNGQLFNKQIIKDGYAYEFTYKGRVYKYQKEFRLAQKYARKRKLGIWADKVCKQD